MHKFLIVLAFALSGCAISHEPAADNDAGSCPFVVETDAGTLTHGSCVPRLPPPRPVLD